MIILDVQKYCHTCPNFEATTIDYTTCDGSNFIVSCVHCVECANIARHLEKQQRSD